MHFGFGNTKGLAHAHNLMGRQGTAAHATLVATTVHLRLDANAGLAAHKQSTYAFRTIGFMSGQAHQINGQSGQVDIYTACGLCCIHMQKHPMLTANSA